MIRRRRLLALGALLAVSARAPLLAGQPAPPPRLLAFGDSLTAGGGLAPDEGLVPVLSAWLAAHGSPARLINAGRGGDTTADGRRRIADALRQGADAVMVELGGNDMLGGLDPAAAERNLDAILTQAGAGGRPVLLVGIQAPPGDPAWRQGWAEMWPRVARRHGALLWADLYAPLAALPAAQQGRMLQADGIHASAEGVRVIVEALGPTVRQLLSRLDDGAAR